MKKIFFLWLLVTIIFTSCDRHEDKVNQCSPQLEKRTLSDYPLTVVESDNVTDLALAYTKEGLPIVAIVENGRDLNLFIPDKEEWQRFFIESKEDMKNLKLLFRDPKVTCFYTFQSGDHYTIRRVVFDIKDKEISLEKLDLGGSIRFFDITQNGDSIVYLDSSSSDSVLMYATRKGDHWDKFLVDDGNSDILKGARFYYAPHLAEFNKTLAVAYFDMNTMKIIVAEKDSLGVWHYSLPFGDLIASPDFAITYDEHGVLMLLARGNDNRLYFSDEVTSGWNYHKILDIGEDVGFNPYLLITEGYIVGVFYNLSWRSISIAERRKPYLNDYGVIEENWTQSLLYFSSGASLNYRVKYLGDDYAGMVWQKDNKVFYREFILR